MCVYACVCVCVCVLICEWIYVHACVTLVSQCTVNFGTAHQQSSEQTICYELGILLEA